MTIGPERETVIEWIEEYAADYFLSKQLPEGTKTRRLETFMRTIKLIYRDLGREQLGRRWIRKAYRLYMKREELLEWIEKHEADYFLSIQFPEETKTSRRKTFMRIIKLLCRDLERELLGKHWIRKPYRFDGFCERGRDRAWHVHILLTCPNRTLEQLKIALDRVGEKYRQRRRTSKAPDIDVKQTYDLYWVADYCVKQLGLVRLAHVRSERYFTAETLFDISASR